MKWPNVKNTLKTLEDEIQYYTPEYQLILMDYFTGQLLDIKAKIWDGTYPSGTHTPP